MVVNPLSRAEAAVDKDGKPLSNLNLFSEAVSKLPILSGSGSPEGVVPSRSKRLYMDTAGTAGSILYIKQVDDVAGDNTLGWILV